MVLNALKATCLRAVVLATIAFALSPSSVRADAPKVWAFLVGIEAYPDLNPLDFPEDDANALFKRFGVHPNFKTEQLLGRDATLARIRTDFTKFLRGAGANDTVVFVFCGHGCSRTTKTASGVENHSYLLPYDAKGDNPETWLRLSDLFTLVKGHKNSIFFLDACRNLDGAPTNNAAQSAVTNNNLGSSSTGTGESAFRGRSVGNAKFLADINVFEFNDTPPKGVVVCSSCSSGESAVESPELRHGVFTKFLLDAFTEKGDLDKDGKLGFTEVENYLHKNVPPYVRKLGELNQIELKQVPSVQKNSGEIILVDFRNTTVIVHDARFKSVNGPLSRHNEFINYVKANKSLAKFDLSNCDLSGVNLDNVDLTSALLKGANLQGASLSGAILKGAFLDNANLRSAQLSDATMDRTSLYGADCRGADFTGVTAFGIKTDQYTKFDGAISPPAKR